MAAKGLAGYWPREKQFEYLRRLFTRCNWMELHGISADGPIIIDLENFFVPLSTPSPLREGESQKQKERTLLSWRLATPVRRKKSGKSHTTGKDGSEARTVQKLLSRHPRLVISGPPGSGKSTTIAYLAAVLARGIGRGDEALLINTLNMKSNAPYPFPVSLLDIQRWVRSRAGRAKKATRLVEPFSGVLRERFGKAAPDMKALDALCRSGKALLLLDGFDEIDDELARDLLLTAIGDLATAYPWCSLLVTTRSSVFDWPVERLMRRGFSATMLFPFESPDIREFTLRWIAAIYAGAVKFNAKSDNLLQGIREYDSLRIDDERRKVLRGLNGRAHGFYRALTFHHLLGEMIGSPLVATALCGILYNQELLPQRAEEIMSTLSSALLSLKREFGHECLAQNSIPAKKMLKTLQRFALFLNKKGKQPYMTIPVRLKLRKMGFIVPTDEELDIFRHDALEEYFLEQREK